MGFEFTTLTITGLQVWCWSNYVKQACVDSFRFSCSIESRNDPSPKGEVVHETKFSLKISYSMSAWSHTVSCGMIAPSFESHQCLAGIWKRWLGCHVGHQEVSRCHTRGESQGTCNITGTPPLSSNKAEPILALKPRGNVTRSPKQGYQWPHKKDSCTPKNFKKKKKISVQQCIQII